MPVRRRPPQLLMATRSAAFPSAAAATASAVKTSAVVAALAAAPTRMRVARARYAVMAPDFHRRAARAAAGR